MGNEAMSIGIIGGADGPTAVFVTGPGAGAYLVLGAALAVAAVVWIIIRKRKKES